MKIIDRFANGLFAPSEVMRYRHDKKWFTFLFFMLLVLLMIIPDIIAINSLPVIDYKTEVSIRSSFEEAEKVPYIIRDNKLVYSGLDGQEKDYYVVPTEIAKIYFTTKEKLQADVSPSETKIVFYEDGIYIETPLYLQRICSYSDYDSFEELNFGLARASNYDFWRQLFSGVNKALAVYQPIINSAYTMIIFIQAFLMVGLGALIFTVFSRFRGMNEYSFTHHFQIMIYLMTPFVIGNVIGALFGDAMFSYIGLIVTVIYSYKVNSGSFGGEKQL